MNHIYRIIWSEALGTWIAVSEQTKSKGKRSNTRNTLLVTGLLLSSNSWALPTGNELIAGQASVNTPNANTMQINQASQKAVINWQGFSVGQQEVVNIQQPNAQAALLNRVVGQDASRIQGKINANGQVYLVNPNGVVFSKTAQVDVGGLVATTHDISNQDFLNGRNHFTQNGAKASVENHGTINSSENGVVALVGEKVINTGSINTPKGTTALAAGKTVDLDFQGDGLVEVKVSEAALNAQISNQGVIQADGGRVVISAKAANQLIDTVINQQGIVKAQGLVERNGEIILNGGENGTIQVSGTLDTQGQQIGGTIKVTGAKVAIQNNAAINASGNNGGGHIVIGDKQTTQETDIAETATISTQANKQGKAGNIEVFANMNSGTVKVAGTLNASAPKKGDGGIIDTSAAKVKIADSAKINTQANNGNSGSWIIDPFDFTIAATGGDITGSALTTALASNSVKIQTGAASVTCTGVVGCGAGNSAGNGDIFVNDVINWTTNKLTLSAFRNIYINANLNGSSTAQLALEYGQGAVTLNNASTYAVNAVVNLPAGNNFSTKLGSDGVVKNYTVITSLGAQNSDTGIDLQGMKANLAGLYALGANIDASPTSTWAGGFLPIANLIPFTGSFEGFGHTISNLTINRPATDNVGLFGLANGATIRNVGMVGGNIIGNANVGSLVGLNQGLFQNITSVNNAYATSNVSGFSAVGGLIGNNQNTTISNVYATGNVAGTQWGGGLVGENNAAIINNAYSTGLVTGTLAFTGGLAGRNLNGTINNSFWNTQTSGKGSTNGVGTNTGTLNNVLGKTTAEMKQFATFSGAGWNIANTGGSSAIWRIYEGNSTPLLRSSLLTLTVTSNGTTNSYSIPSAESSGHLFGTGAGIYSDQQGYDILGAPIVVVTPPVIAPTPPVTTPETPPDVIPAARPSVISTVTPLSLIQFLQSIFGSKFNQFIQIIPNGPNVPPPELTPLRISTTFQHWLDERLAYDDYVDHDYGQYKGSIYLVKALNYEQRKAQGKQHWYEKKRDKPKNIYHNLFFIIENNGMKLPEGLPQFISTPSNKF